MAMEVLLPKLGVTMAEGKILKWLKKEGDYVEAGEALFEIETDKASMEVESTDGGYLKKILVNEGETVPVTTSIAILGDKDEDIITNAAGAAGKSSGTEKDTEVMPEAQIPAEKYGASSGTIIIATPRAKKTAKHKGVDLSKVKGTGENGRISEEDVLNYIKESIEGGAAVNEALREGPEILPYDGIRRIIGDRLSMSCRQSPHIYMTAEVCMQKCIDLKNSMKERYEGVNISDFIVKAAAKALVEYPMINSSLEDDRIVIRKEINIGFAVDAPKGLIVPVIAKAGKKSIEDMAKDRSLLVGKAVANTLKPADLQGGTFTISNLGTYGIDSFTAIINPPECAILAVSSIKKKLIVEDDDSIKIKPMMNITLSVDHRIVDGAMAAKFICSIKKHLEQPDIEGEVL